jgi:hypothetical protein
LEFAGHELTHVSQGTDDRVYFPVLKAAKCLNVRLAKSLPDLVEDVIRDEWPKVTAHQSIEDTHRRRKMPRTRMLVSTTALTSARGTADSLHGSVDHVVDVTIGPRITSTSHLVDENAEPHLRCHHGFEKLCLVLHG